MACRAVSSHLVLECASCARVRRASHMPSGHARPNPNSPRHLGARQVMLSETGAQRWLKAYLALV